MPRCSRFTHAKSQVLSTQSKQNGLFIHTEMDVKNGNSNEVRITSSFITEHAQFLYRPP